MKDATMSFFKRLTRLLSASPPKDPFYHFTVVCNRCGEQIEGRVNTSNDLSQQDEDEGGGAVYFARKTLVGDSLCFQRVEVELTFDKDRKILGREITGGKFVD
jgi:hypothetical protein